MKAVEFVAKFGWAGTRDLIENHENCYMPDVFDMWSNKLQDFVLATKYASFEMKDFKTLVKAKELVDLNKGIDESLYSPAVIEAIKLVESVGNA